MRRQTMMSVPTLLSAATLLAVLLGGMSHVTPVSGPGSGPSVGGGAETIGAKVGDEALPRDFSTVSADAHLDLDSAAPAPGSEVIAPERIDLWFTDEPQEGSVRVRLLDEEEDLVQTGDLVRSDGDPKHFFLPITDSPGVGAYTVVWRGMGPDGHVATGEFGFAVVEARP